MPWSKKDFLVATAFLAGVSLIVAGQALYWYFSSTIQSLETKLLEINLTQSEHYAMEGSLNWWQEKAATFGPLSLIVIVIGIATVLFLSAFCVLSIFKNRKTNHQ